MAEAEIDSAARIYFIAGRTHIDSRVGIIGRALLIALDRWVSLGVDPPPSVIPRIDDDALAQYRKSLELNPDNADAKERIEHIKRDRAKSTPEPGVN